MTSINLTPAQLEEAEIYGMTPEEYKAMLDQKVLAKGTYDFIIAGGKVEQVAKDGFFKDAIQANLQFKVLDSNGNPAKRYETVFVRVTLPIATGAFVPNSITQSQGIAAIKWLAEQTGVSQKDIVNNLKQLQLPAGLLLKKVRGYFNLRQDKNDPNKQWPEVRPAKASDKVTALTPDGSNGGSVSAAVAAGAMESAASNGHDSEVPF